MSIRIHQDLSQVQDIDWNWLSSAYS